MTRAYANKILDAVRAGKPRVSHIAIRKALIVTGDLAEQARKPVTRRMPNYGRTR